MATSTVSRDGSTFYTLETITSVNDYSINLNQSGIATIIPPTGITVESYEIGLSTNDGTYTVVTQTSTTKSFSLSTNKKYQCRMRPKVGGEWLAYKYSNVIYTTPTTPTVAATGNSQKQVVSISNLSSIPYVERIKWEASTNGSTWTTLTEYTTPTIVLTNSSYKNFRATLYTPTEIASDSGTGTLTTIPMVYVDVNSASAKDIKFQISSGSIKNINFYIP